MRALQECDDEFTDPEASYRRGYQQGAHAILEIVAGQLNPAIAKRLNDWVYVKLHGWRIPGREESKLRKPPLPPSV